jgi:hypothetical protein
VAYRIQKSVIQTISGANKCKSYRLIFKEYRILTVTSLYISQVLCYTKRYIGNLKQNLSTHSHKMRSKLNLHVQFCNTALLQRSVVNMGSNFVTKCQKVQKIEDFKLFKQELESLLLSHSFCLVGEFLQFWVKLICQVLYQLYQINIMISHHGIVLYCTVLYCIGLFMVIGLSHHIDKYFINVTVSYFVYTF